MRIDTMMESTPRWRALLRLPTAAAVALMSCLLSPACSPGGGNGENDGGAEAPGGRQDLPGAQEAAADSLPSIPGTDPGRFDAFLAPLFERVDPREDGWDTEVLSEAVGERLKVLVELIEQPQEADAAEVEKLLEQLVTNEFSADPLRPLPLEPVFTDASIVVLRPSAPDAAQDAPGTGQGREPPPAARARGAAALAKALAALREPVRDAEDRHAKFKVIRVEEQGAETFTTTALFQSSARTPRGIVQQSAVWRCGWMSKGTSKGVSKGEGTDCRLSSISVSDYEEIVPGPAGGIRFADCTQGALGSVKSFREQLTRGVDYWRDRLEANYGVDPNGHQGIAIGDADGDGLDDLYVCQQGGLPNRLYLRNPDGTLRDASTESGVDWMEVCRSALFVDLDNDGDQDLVMAQGWHLMIMENDGSGRFRVTMEERSSANLYSTAAADYDNDGDLDLFFCGRNPGREKGRPEALLGTPIPYHDANNGGPNLFLENDGRGRFTDVTEAVGLDANNRRYTFAASWEDFDGDGDPDLYVANDYGRNNLYRNDVDASGKRRFEDVAAELGVEDISAGMSVSWGDYNNDGLMDIYVANMFSSAGNRIAYQRRFRPESPNDTLKHFRRHARGNTLFESLPDGGFRDVSVVAGVTMGRWAWASKFVDLNSDGLEDLYVTNGYLTTEDTGDL